MTRSHLPGEKRARPGHTRNTQHLAGFVSSWSYSPLVSLCESDKIICKALREARLQWAEKGILQHPEPVLHFLLSILLDILHLWGSYLIQDKDNDSVAAKPLLKPSPLFESFRGEVQLVTAGCCGPLNLKPHAPDNRAGRKQGLANKLFWEFFDTWTKLFSALLCARKSRPRHGCAARESRAEGREDWEILSEQRKTADKTPLAAMEAKTDLRKKQRPCSPLQVRNSPLRDGEH